MRTKGFSLLISLFRLIFGHEHEPRHGHAFGRQGSILFHGRAGLLKLLYVFHRTVISSGVYYLSLVRLGHLEKGHVGGEASGDAVCGHGSHLLL